MDRLECGAIIDSQYKNAETAIIYAGKEEIALFLWRVRGHVTAPAPGVLSDSFEGLVIPTLPACGREVVFVCFASTYGP
jgi:hypothetical protein